MKIIKSKLIKSKFRKPKLIKSKYDGVSYELHPGRGRLCTMLYPRYNNIKNGRVLERFMVGEVSNFYSEIKKILEEVNNNGGYYECGFNICDVDFTKEYIKVIDLYADEDDDYSDECVIKTDLFNLLLEEYYDYINRFV